MIGFANLFGSRVVVCKREYVSMSENRGLVAVVVVLLVALVGLVCVGVGAVFYCPQPGSLCFPEK